MCYNEGAMNPPPSAPSRAPDKPSSPKPSSLVDQLRESQKLAIRAIPPIVVVNQMFPGLVIEEEVAGRSWKVRMDAGHLHIDGPVFNLLEDSKNRQFSGGGGIDAYCVLSAMPRANGDSFKRAKKALVDYFFPWADDQSIPIRERIARLDQATVVNQKVNVATTNRREHGPVGLPPICSAQNDLNPARRYLEIDRGLPRNLIAHAFQANAVYAHRMESKFPGSPGPLRLIFPLCNYRTGEMNSYSARSVFGSMKKNKGDKMNAGFVIGNFEEGQSSVLFVEESPIEAMSRWALLEKELAGTGLLRECVVVGVNGSGRQIELLQVAKERGIRHVKAGYNNDYAGRDYSATLIADAKEIGLEASLDLVPGGEIEMSVYPHPQAQSAAGQVAALVAQIGLKSLVLDPSGQRTRARFPNIAQTCDLVQEIDKARIGVHVISGKNEPTLLANRQRLVDEFTASAKSFAVKEEEEGWKVTVHNDVAVQAAVNTFKNAHRAQCDEDPEYLTVDFNRLIKFNFMVKDFNDVVLGSKSRLLPDHDFERQPSLVETVREAASHRLAAPGGTEPEV